MCLATITEKYDKPSDLIIDGWKIFTNSTSQQPRFEAMSYKGLATVPLDEWLVAEGGDIQIFASNNKYRAGFHVYQEDPSKRQRDGVSHMRRVYIRKVHTKGTQDNRVVLVASEMYVPSNEHAWPPKDDEPKKKSLRDRIIGKGGNA